MAVRVDCSPSGFGGGSGAVFIGGLNGLGVRGGSRGGQGSQVKRCHQQQHPATTKGGPFVRSSSLVSSSVVDTMSSVTVDVRMEKRAQKFLLFIIIFHFICWLPLNVLK